ncbi:hypothetical protein QZM82_38810 [Burkholderia cepacia]|uniref:phosphoribosyltransferase-like protein n=1 Tax=Burkholderia cepacia TaxID=292 RepID=UPI002654DD7A|nr:hypothetical protein [Burkholderia cepacia]MDN7902149.1 hypothetical protein [Burkholderia cepacia]
MSSKLFPKIDHTIVADTIGRTHYLSLPWHFISASDLKVQVDGLQAAVPRGQTFREWKVIRARKFRLIVDVPDEIKRFHKLDLYSEYILGLRASDVKPRHLTELFRRFREYVAKDVYARPGHESPHGTCSLLLAPILKWRSIAPKVGAELVHILEDVIDATSSRLRSDYSSDLLAYQNFIFFTYFVTAQVVEVGVNPATGSGFLTAFRHIGPGKWASTRSDVRVQFAALMLAFFHLFYDLDKPFATKHGFSHNVLADFRSVFHVAGTSEFEAAFAPSQWVFRWIVDKLDVEVFTTVGRADISGLAALSYVEQNLVVELVRRFSVYRVPISVESATNFILQFGSTQRIRGAIRLLTHVKFYRLWELAQAIERLLAAELKKSGEQTLVISSFGEHTGSAAIMNYLVAHSTLARSLRFEPNLPAALAATPAEGSIYIVDDCLLSGTQGLNTLGDLMGTRVTKSHHTVHAQKLTASDKRRLRNRHLRFTYGVAMDDGMARFLGDEYAAVGLDPQRAKVFAGTTEPVSSRIFDPLGPVGWLNEEERDEMKAFCEDVGYRILEGRAKAKGWTDKRRRESALGFSDRQRLLVFPYNVPKTTLTLLWERSSGDFHWNPLFPGFD